MAWCIFAMGARLVVHGETAGEDQTGSGQSSRVPLGVLRPVCNTRGLDCAGIGGPCLALLDIFRPILAMGQLRTVLLVRD